MDKKKVMKLVAAVSAMLGLIVVVMTLFFVNGREKQNAPVSVTGVEKEGSYSAKNTWREQTDIYDPPYNTISSFYSLIRNRA